MFTKKMGKMLGTGIVLTALVASLTACGGSGNGNGNNSNNNVVDNSPSQSPTEVTETKKEQVNLRFSWWGSDARHQATLEAIDAYTALNPHVTIEGEYQGYDGYQQKIMTQIAGNSAPDLMQLDYPWLPDLSEQGDTFVDLSKEEAIDHSQFPASVLEEYVSIGDKLVALPMGTNGYGTMINKAFFDKFDLSVDTQWTWEKLIEEGSRINAENKDHYLFAIEPGTTTGGLGEFVLSEYLYSKNGEYWISDAPAITATKEDIIEALSLMKKLFDSGTAQPLGDAALFTSKMEQNPKWVNGEIGMVVDWSATVSKYKAASGEDKFAAGLPIFADGGKSTEVKFKPSMILAVNKNSAHKDEAVKFVNWMLNSEEAAMILQDTRSVPTSDIAMKALVDAKVLDDDVAMMVDNALKNPMSSPPTVQNKPEIADIIRDLCEKVVYGSLTPEKATEQLLERLEDKFQELK
ncbi:ABC transporter substrate-binding protein [Paenibacillus sp. IITD108]|uniref:ABC transporter substrate-binding protein n=1 Tax=Paenibacillus sp. IITD108 TaxID=3116649 RepID=UPI002F3F9373